MGMNTQHDTGMQGKGKGKGGNNGIAVKAAGGQGVEDAQASTEEVRPFRPTLLSGFAAMSGDNVVISRADLTVLLENADRGAQADDEAESAEESEALVSLANELAFERRFSLFHHPMHARPVDENNQPLSKEAIGNVDTFLVQQRPDASVRFTGCEFPDAHGDVLRLGQEGVFFLEIKLRKVPGGKMKIDLSLSSPSYEEAEARSLPLPRFLAELASNDGYSIGIPGTEISVNLWSRWDGGQFFEAVYETMRIMNKVRKAAREAVSPRLAITATASVAVEPAPLAVSKPSVRPPPTPANAQRAPTPAQPLVTTTAPDAEDVSAAATLEEVPDAAAAPTPESDASNSKG